MSFKTILDMNSKLKDFCLQAEEMSSNEFQVKEATYLLKQLKLYVDLFDKERTSTEDKSSRKVRSQGEFDTIVDDLNATRFRTVSAISMLETELEFAATPTTVSNYSPTHHSITAKLPKLQIKTFNGDSLKFNEFWQLYEINVHNNSALSPVEKFNYLISFLSDNAKKCIEGIQISKENYETAIRILKEKYGNQELLVTKHYNELTRLPRAKYFASSLRCTYEEVVKHLRSLENLGEIIEQKIFMTIITSKFPSNIQLEIEKHKLDKENFTVENLLKFIRGLITAQENVYMAEMSYVPKSCPSTSRYTTENFALGEDTECLLRSENKNFKCFFCKAKHWTDECPIVITIEERKKLARGHCFNCFNKSHSIKECPVDRPCFYCKRRRNHHRSLCPQRFPEEAQDNGSDARKEEKPEIEQCGMAVTEAVTMQTAGVRIQAPSKENSTFKVRALLDSGSQRTYISEDLRKKLDLPIKQKQILSVHVFGKSKPNHVSTSLVELDLELKDGRKMRIFANVVPTIMGSHVTKNFEFSLLNLPKDVVLADDERGRPIDVLIGNDYYFDIVLNTRKQLSPGLYLVNTKLGWLVSGRVPTRKMMEEDTVSFLTCSTQEAFSSELDLVKWTKPDILPFSDPAESDFLKTLWDLETIGIRECPNQTDDDLAIQNFNDSIQFIGGRYFVSWPWRFYPPNLPSGFGLALGRLKSLLPRIQQNKELLQNYENIFQDQIQKQIIEEVHSEQESKFPVHYLPHHPVITPDKTTTKVRIVFDGSAKTRKTEKSLNEILLRGRILMEDLVGILLRIRTYKYAVTADIEKAFLQISLHEKDKDVTRFLWLKDNCKPATNDNLKVYRFQRVAFGIISSPFLLNAVVKHHLIKNPTKFTERIARNMYVDNMIVGVNSEEEVLELQKEGREIFQRANMNLREWESNAPCLKSPTFTSGGSIKLLGIKWKIDEDYFSICSKYSPTNSSLTKREVLRFISSFYDPLGYFSPVLLGGKLFLRRLWDSKCPWDAVMEDSEVLESWNSIQQNLRQIMEVKILRYIPRITKDLLELHCFSDASKDAYAFCIYLRVVNSDKIRSNLVFAKTRNAPISTSMTIPRLELTAVLIGIRALKFVKKELDLDITRIILWTDSKCVLHWLHHRKLHDCYVEKRLEEIKSLKNVLYQYVPSKENPADLATRVNSTSDLNSLWWEGPGWLSQEEILWPPQSIVYEKEVEEHNPANNIFTLPVAETDEVKAPFDLSAISYSSVTRLLHVTAYCSRFLSKLRSVSTSERIGRLLTINEIHESTRMWVSYVQQKHFLSVFSSLQKGQPNNLVSQLGLWSDENGIMRCKGRIISPEFDDAQNFPILMPYNERFTELLIIKCHEKLAHAGVSHTLSELRKLYWVIKGRALVRKVLKRCLICKYYSGGAFQAPTMPPLPYARVSKSLAFSYTGLDYFGFLNVRAGERNAVKKVWICLFTCLATRAVHLEIVNDLTAEEFLMALRRFIAIRGRPVQLISDNASQFKLTKTLLDETWHNIIYDDGDIKNFLIDQRIEWYFIPELSPWHGGFYERLVAIVKAHLKRTILRSVISLVQLQTLVAEIGAIINSRPLVYVTDDINSNDVLTPSHFLSLRTCSPLGRNHENEVDESDLPYSARRSTKQLLIESWNKGQRLLNQFWQSWRNDYLQTLRERRDTRLAQGRIVSSATPKIGSVVLIGDQIPRSCWRMGLIVDLVGSQDGQVRTAKVRISTGRILNRSVKHLYPLEVPEEDHIEEEVSSQDASLIGPDTLSNQRELQITQDSGRRTSDRKAAALARQRLAKHFEAASVAVSED